MTGTAQILWIDDSIAKPGSSSKAILELMGRTAGVKAFGCHPWSLASELKTGSKYDLFLVDYRLSKEPFEKQGRYPFTGISVGGLVRDEYPEHPIYLTSALLTDSSTIVVDSELFDRIVTNKSLTTRSGIELLRNDALDYRRIRNAKLRGTIKSLYRLLRSPQSAYLEIQKVLPEELRQGLGARQPGRTKISAISPRSIRFGRWVTQFLLANPGVLYDDLYAATYLGATLSFFHNRLQQDLVHERYVGVFASTHTRHWWRSSLTQHVIEHPRAKKFKTLRIWELAPELLQIPKQARPKCEVCGKPYPETVAYDRDNENRRGPAHFACSEPDPERQPILYFEPFRVFVD